MNNFIILFQEKEGTTAMVNLLDNLEQISYVRLNSIADSWEPFNAQNCGNPSTKTYCKLLDMVFDPSASIKEINDLYSDKGKDSLQEIDQSKSVGFKMRFWPATRNPFIRLLNYPFFERKMIKTFKDRNVHVFIAVRQDIYRWGLSKYHGDGTGKKGHMQFKVARGAINIDEIPKIKINKARFELILKGCEFIHWRKRRLYKKLKRNNIKVYPITYEDFHKDNKFTVRYISDKLGLSVDEREIEKAVQQGTKFKKVHSNNVAQFVINHEEINKKFGERKVSWDKYIQ